MQQRYADILISSGERETQGSCSALIAARVVVVPIDARHVMYHEVFRQ
jgi:hypothetical protein